MKANVGQKDMSETIYKKHVFMHKPSFWKTNEDIDMITFLS